jgi:transcriptional regulator with XRE-family HTH domain
MVEQDIRKLVKRLRERMGLTQEQFAQEVGVTFSTVNQWENGHRYPQPYLLNRLLELDGSVAKVMTPGLKRRKNPKRER